ncbi:hypothetical protein [Azohydromonas caseinilytica]|uniref:Uncharacterized protein n=1 Tax=Azohydromonas caseinilytica TaxID=2728836 RepID=A0A848FKB7_9BURK|nr:hypothetical protein [Azohydromonas caseinilytica]NML18769.1 hypothetical protein [Azohydromonas caseinilytica]
MPADPLRPFRTEAKRLIKQLHSDNAAEFMPAVRRLHACGLVRHESLVATVARRRTLSLKHAYELLAREAGAPGWPALLDRDALPAVARLALDGGRHLNRWFATFEEAERERLKDGGVIVQAGHTFGLVEEAAARHLGLNADAPERR